METLPLRKRTRLSSEKEPQTLLNPEDMAHQTKAKRLSFGTSLSEDVDGALDGVGKSVAVLTSGGDSQGMNSALRAIVRLSLHHGMRVYAVHEGYQGLVDGGEKGMEECSWNSVSNILHKGGTVIGTARCRDFREREGRLRAAANLVKRGIGNLVVIGGDGSLTGASVFKEEWTGLLAELQQEQRITAEEAAKCRFLNIVGLVGSIDNDMCGTDMTIGTDSALHRIIEAIDCLTSTAASHQRSFVLEVMGRHCGYLAQMAAIAGRADWVLIPEKPPEPGWEDVMCQKMQTCRGLGERLSIVIVSEGAVDKENKPITSQYVKKVIETRLGHNTRITVLGHVQRGGKPSAYDRLIACRMGAAAVLVLLQATGEIPPTMIGVQGNYICQIPLMECVEATRNVNRAMQECNFERAQALRGTSFLRNIKVSRRISSCGPQGCGSKPSLNESGNSYRVAIMNVGSPAAGMNSTVRAFVRLMTYSGHTVLGIEEGFEGLLLDRVREMGWHDVSEWDSAGGSFLGTNRTSPNEETLPTIAEKFTKHGIQGLLIVGGFDGFESLVTLQKRRSEYPAFQIPLLGIAATVSNNVPGTDCSLGSDTALNTIVSMCDVLRQSANASRKRVFVVQTMGGYCGYLATMAGLAAGADTAYIFEDNFTISDMHNDVARLVGKFQADGIQRGIITRSERCSVNFTSEFMCQLLAEEGRGMFVTESNVLGHLQQGDRPSPYDRILGTKYAAHAVDFFMEQMEKLLRAGGGGGGISRAMDPRSACMVGIRGTSMVTTPIQDLVEETDFAHRIPKQQWWMSLRALLHVLARDRNHVFLGEEHLRSINNQ
jgi:6-phosphofructokinase 1